MYGLRVVANGIDSLYKNDSLLGEDRDYSVACFVGKVSLNSKNVPKTTIRHYKASVEKEVDRLSKVFMLCGSLRGYEKGRGFLEKVVLPNNGVDGLKRVWGLSPVEGLL